MFLFQNGGEFLIQANTRKRLKVQEDVNTNVFEVEVCFHMVTLLSQELAMQLFLFQLKKIVSLYQAVIDGRKTNLEPMETKNNDANRKKSGRGRGSSGSGRGRGSKSNDQTRTQNSLPASDVSHKVSSLL